MASTSGARNLPWMERTGLVDIEESEMLLSKSGQAEAVQLISIADAALSYHTPVA